MTGTKLCNLMKPDGAGIRVFSHDEYDPVTSTIHISAATGKGTDQFALFRAAHECGHAIQHLRMHRSYWFWSNPLAQGLMFPLMGVALTVVAVLCARYEWEAVALCGLLWFFRKCVVIWIEKEASIIAWNYMDLHGLITDHDTLVNYMHRLLRSYIFAI